MISLYYYTSFWQMMLCDCLNNVRSISCLTVSMPNVSPHAAFSSGIVTLQHNLLTKPACPGAGAILSILVDELDQYLAIAHIDVVARHVHRGRAC
jgi:hypothetical protein